MKKLLKIYTIYLIISILLSNYLVFANDIDYTIARKYSLSQFSYDYIIKMMYTNYKWQLAFYQRDEYNTYDRYLKWTSSAKDISIKNWFCRWNKTCETEQYYPAIKWNATLRDMSIPYFTLAVQVFQNKMDVLNWKAKEFDYISTKYWISTYDWIVKNKTSVDSSFNKYVTWERNLISSWYFKEVQDSSFIKKPIDTYGWYVYFIWIKKLENMQSKAKTNLTKAIYEYFKYKLLTDERLYMAK